MIDEQNERLIQGAEKEYLEFLDDEDDQGLYHKRVKEMIEEGRQRLLVNINDVRQKKPERADKLLSSSAIEQIAFKNALKQYVSSLDPTYEKEEFNVGFEGSFGQRHVTPRTLTSRHLNNMVCLEGIVTQCSHIKAKLVRSVHYCPSTQKMMERKYADLTSLNPIVTSAIYPTKDIDGNLLETEFGLCCYKDHQTLVIQEMPERAPAGQLPRAVDVICDDDLADKCKPGDRVQMIGLFRCLPAKKGSFTTGVFRTVIIANNVTHLNKEMKLAMTRTDIVNCRKIARRENVFEMLGRSLAPSIHGHEYVKKAILCMLLGGVEKVLANGTRLRGDINILLIGDPSVAKSQLLRYVLCTAPRAIATTGRGSSGVGLTAAVTHDKETGERKLEAGAMVLADRGIVCIDEFDKMSDMDRTAIHEVMEQGRVTIAKAGIHARLNARCSVLAAANPIYGRYDRYKPPMENIGLQDSLLSRFDLLFVMLDDFDADTDTKISDHVLRMHQYRNPGEQDGAVLPMGSGVEFLTTGNLGDSNLEDGPAPIFEKYDPLLHGNTRTKSDRIFTVKFMRLYLHLAKTLKPVLTDEACALITEEYARLRSQDSVEAGFARTQPVTVRTLETLIRLSTAHAKARLSCQIEEEDAKTAIELVQFAYFKKVVDKERKKRRHESEDEEDGEDQENDSQPRNRRRIDDDPFSFPSDFDSTTQDVTIPDPTPSTEPEPETSRGSISTARLEKFRKLAAKAFMEKAVQHMAKDEFISFIQANTPDEEFSESEISMALTQMSNDNAIMAVEDKIFLI